MTLKKLGRYDLIRLLGRGAMGLVYEARDPNLDRRVAIKTIKVENLSEEAAADYEVRFRTEARSAARLQHPNIVSVYDSDRDIDIAYLVMEFIEGEDLKHHLDKGELFSLEQTLGIMADLLSALSYAHKHNIVHRDIKPANLLIQASGRIKLTDFGVARIQDSGDVTRTQGTIVGTLKYMSPEQLQGRPVDARADLFAAGVVLYQLLTGKRPFDGDSDFAVIQQIAGHTPTPPSLLNPKLPSALDAVLARVLDKSRDVRFATAQEFANALVAASKQAIDPTVVPLTSAARGANSTWTATMQAGESLLGTHSGTGSGTALGTQSGLQSGTLSGTSASSIVTQEVELVYWKDIKESADVNDIRGFLTKFPTGIYADLAHRRLKQLGVTYLQPFVASLQQGPTYKPEASPPATANVPAVPQKVRLEPRQDAPQDDGTMLASPSLRSAISADEIRTVPAEVSPKVQETGTQDIEQTIKVARRPDALTQTLPDVIASAFAAAAASAPVLLPAPVTDNALLNDLDTTRAGPLNDLASSSTSSPLPQIFQLPQLPPFSSLPMIDAGSASPGLEQKDAAAAAISDLLTEAEAAANNAVQDSMHVPMYVPMHDPMLDSGHLAAIETRSPVGSVEAALAADNAASPDLAETAAFLATNEIDHQADSLEQTPNNGDAVRAQAAPVASALSHVTSDAPPPPPAPVTAAVSAAPKRWLWALAGVIGLVAAGVGVSRWPGSGGLNPATGLAGPGLTASASATSVAPVEPVALNTPTATVSNTVSAASALSASESLVITPSLSAATGTTPSQALSPSLSGVISAALSASSPASAPLPLSAASKAARAAAVDARKTAALEKERDAQAKRALARTAATEQTSAVSSAPAAPVAAVAALPSLDAACEGRVFLGRQSCLSEQCAKPAYAKSAVCIERRAMDEQRRALQNGGN
ncbi:MAG: serine/threonine protein kinase [Chitinophagaceae bacterium]|nr:serine/threonine protein kinase [Polaromonas sp.]